MKPLLDWRSKEIVNIYDEVSLWSAPFGRVLLENIPMKQCATVVDLGFGTGFPLIELAQRFGEDSTVVGVDIWEQAILRTREKIKQFGLTNVLILEESAADMSIEKDSVDLVCSNLGVNNFAEKELVYERVHTILKSGGHLCITTNDDSTFKELFSIFKEAIICMGHEVVALEHYVAARSTQQAISQEISDHGFLEVKKIKDQTSMRFTSADAVFDHALMRIAFIESWQRLVSPEEVEAFFTEVKRRISEVIRSEGVFSMTVPILYLQFQKV